MDYKNKIVFVADIDQDIDDLIAIEYLHIHGYLNCVVLDGLSNDENREDKISKMGIKIKEDIPEDTDIIFCGGGLTKVANYVINNKLKLLVANGGYVGSNIVPKEFQIKKFRGKEKVRTYNFNLDVTSAKLVLNSKHIKQVILVSKNVCHNMMNTQTILHNDNFIKKYKLDNRKRLHDLLMVKEGINYLEFKDAICYYIQVRPVFEARSPDNMTLWGSELDADSNIIISRSFLKKNSYG